MVAITNKNEDKVVFDGTVATLTRADGTSVELAQKFSWRSGSQTAGYFTVNGKTVSFGGITEAQASEINAFNEARGVKGGYRKSGNPVVKSTSASARMRKLASIAEALASIDGGLKTLTEAIEKCADLQAVATDWRKEAEKLEAEAEAEKQKQAQAQAIAQAMSADDFLAFKAWKEAQAEKQAQAEARKQARKASKAEAQA